MKRFALWLAGAVAVVGLALSGAATAGAATAGHVNGVSNVPHYTQAGDAATSGYFTSAIGTYFTHISGYIGSNGTTSLENLAVTSPPSNGAGVGLCSQSTSYAVRAGDLYLGGGLMDVAWGAGNLGAAQWFNNPCANGVIPAPEVLLSNVPVTDTIAAQILTDPRHEFNGCHADDVSFAVEDVTANPGVWVQSPCFKLPHGTVFNEADAGVISDTQNMSVPAGNLLAVFAHLGLTANLGSGHAAHGSFQANANWTAYPVIATSNGLGSGSQLLVPQAFSQDHFVENSGFPTG
jgi:hypothetical protein